MMLICYAIVLWLFNATLANTYSYSYNRSYDEQLFSFVLIVILLIAFVPAALAITCRRCHDVGWSGWVQLVTAIPFVNIALALYLLLKPGDKGTNQYGPPPDDDQEEQDGETRNS